jgi:hypothetical protein
MLSTLRLWWPDLKFLVVDRVVRAV